LSLEHDLIGQRLDRVQQIQALGFKPYGHRFDASHTIPRILADFSAKTGEELEAARVPVKIAGRIQTLRRMGKAGFAHLMQRAEKLQVYIKKDAISESEYALYQLLDIGDLIACEGYLFRTRTGELSVHVEKLDFLSKALLPMPEKWHGLENVETRYRQRYLDMIANPGVQQTFVKRAKIVSACRHELESRQFVEVETPMMQPLYGGAAANPFITHHNTLDMPLYLRIAPELYLKRLVVGGLERVYEINKNFRNEGISTRHNPEFTMLEFYQAYTDYLGLMDLSEELLRAVAVAANGTTKAVYDGREIDFETVRRLTMREAVIEFWKAGEKPSLDNVKDPEWLKRHSSKASPGECLVDLFERYAEGELFQPTMIYEYPVEVSPLSKNNEADPAFVDRFEIYCAGMEIGNAYTELNDPNEQRRRFEMQLSMRERGDSEAHQMDEDYVRALCYGMPPTGGEGIGIDRLTMILTDSKSIRDVILFPLLRAEGEIGLAERLRAFDKK
jgi:lysyl-tRNA synthetase class 2